MAHHTCVEVPRVLAKRSAKEGVDRFAAEWMWSSIYVKVIRFVSTADLPEGSPELRRGGGRPRWRCRDGLSCDRRS